MFSPVMLFSSRMTFVVFQMMALRKYLFKNIEAFYFCMDSNKAFFFLSGVSLLCFSWVNNTRRPWQTKVFGKNVDPHLDLSLKKKTEDLSGDILQYTDIVELCSVVVTWDNCGWWELYKVLVSTCSGTKP